MALQLTPAGLLQEVEAAEKVREKHIRLVKKLVKRYVGNWWRDDHRSTPVPENMIFSYIAGILPKIVWDNPSVQVQSNRAITYAPVASWMKHALDAWIKQTDLRNELELLAIDMLFCYGAAKIGLEARGDFMADPTRGVFERFNFQALQPFLIRIDPQALVVDSKALTIDGARFIGHQFQRDLSELQQDERYNQEAVAKLTADNDTKYGAQTAAFASPSTDNMVDRGRVTLYELWIAESGMICTIAKSASTDPIFVRDPAPYVGPRQGPFVLFGVYGVPGSAYPLSPIAAMAEQFQELNAHATAAAREAESHKKLILTDSANATLTNAISTARTGSVVAVPGFSTANTANVELGGTSQARMVYLEQLRERLDRVIGFSESQRGRVSGGTATEATIASESADVRTGWIERKFRDGVREGLGRIGWFFFFDPNVVMPITYADDMGQQREGLFLGGTQEGQDGMDWIDFALDIEPQSMRRVDPAEQQRIAQLTMEIAITLAPAVVQFPYINWREITDQLGESLNIPDFSRLIFNQMGLQMLGSGGVLPGMLPMMTDPGVQAGLMMNPPPTANPALQAGMQGHPVNSMMGKLGRGQRPQLGGPRGAAGGNAAMMNPGARAFASLGFAGRGGAMAASN